ncbi:MAG: hypothetical protein RIM84_22205 [Alphaproteobacteria bacterium]
MTIKVITTILASVALAGFVITATRAQPSDSKMPTKDMMLAPCELHVDNSQDCHVHDKNTYLHMKRQSPAPGPHARSELRDLRKKERSQRRGNK